MYDFIDNNIEKLSELEIGDIMRDELIFQQAKKSHRIWQGKGKDRRWKFKTSDGRLIARTTEKDIKTAYLRYLNAIDKGKSGEMTFGKLYAKWLEYRAEEVGTNRGDLSPSSYKRFVNDYKKYIEPTDFDKKEIGLITPADIEEFFLQLVKEHKMKGRCFGNVEGYVRNTFEYAYKKEYLSKNPFPKADLRRARKKCDKTVNFDSERTLTNEEMQKLLNTVRANEAKNECYMPNYAIELALITGMRVGEIAALRWDCISSKGIIIKYSEHRFDYIDKPHELGIGDTKNKKHRIFPMTPELKKLFAKIKAVQKKNGIVDKFVFADKNGRITAQAISNAVPRRCRNAGIPEKSIHAIRRTVSSNLRTELPLAVVANLLGHLESTNEEFYNYDTTETKLKSQAISNIWKKTCNSSK